MAMIVSPLLERLAELDGAGPEPAPGNGDRARLKSINADLLAACEAALVVLCRRPLDKVSIAADMLRAAIKRAKGE